jgi:autotransporter-associated beta strand protein
MLVSVSTLALTTAAGAETWTATGGGAWTAPSNWGGGSVPNGVGAEAIFPMSPITPSNYSISLGTNTVTVGSMSVTAHSMGLYSFFNGTLVFDAGAGRATLTTNGTSVLPITFQSDLALRLNSDTEINSNASLAIRGGISGTGGLIIAGPSGVVLAGANTYTGATTVQAGTLIAGGPNALSARSDFTIASGANLSLGLLSQTIGSLAGAGTVDIDGATLTVGGNNRNTSFSGTITGSGNLVVQGSGTLALTGANTYSGGTQLNVGATVSVAGSSALGTGWLNMSAGSTLDLQNGASVGNSINAYASFTMNVAAGASATYSGQIYEFDDPVRLVKTGGGTLTLTQDNGMGNGAILRGGTVLAETAGALGRNQLVFEGGTLKAGYSGTLRNNQIELRQGGGTIDTNGNLLTISGQIIETDSPGGALVKTGFGTLTLQAPSGLSNSYSGATRVEFGTLAAGSVGAFSSRSAFVVAANGLLDLGTASQTIGSLAGNGSVDLRGNSLVTGGDNSSTTFSGFISGTGSLIQQGSGTLTLTGFNGYSGGTTVTSGATISVGHNNALGTGAVTGAGGTLDIQSGVAIGNLAILTGDLTLRVGSGVGSYNGTFSGAGVLTKTGAGTLVLGGGPNTFGGLVVSQGTLRADGALSLGTGTVTLNGGTVQAGTAGTFSNSAFQIKAAGGSLDTNGHNVTYAGAISNAPGASGGGLTKTGAGILTLTGTSTYSGGTLVAQGTLKAGGTNVFSAFSTYTIATGAVLDFNGFNQVVGGLAGAGQLNQGSNSLTVGGDNENTVFTGNITGTGGLTKQGSGTLVINTAQTYAGTTVVESGKLVINGTIVSPVVVETGGTLGGNGTVGNLTVNGMLSPGNSIGLITVAGNATFAAGSTLVVEVSGTNADRTNVTGTATIAGGLSLVPVGGSYRFGAQYTLVSAAGGLTGQFNPVATASGFGPAIGTVMSYTATDAILTLEAKPLTPFLAADAPLNARNVAGGIDRAVASGRDPSVFMPLYLQQPAAMANTLAGMSGEAATGTQNAAFGAASLFLNLMLDPMAGARGATAGGAAPSLVQMADLSNGRPRAVAADQGWSVWTKAFAQSNRIDGDGAIGTARTSGGLFGLAVGADRRLTPDTLVGFALAGGGTNFGLGQARGSGTGDLFQAGLYGSTRFGDGYVSAALAYGWNGFDVTRTAGLDTVATYTSRINAQTYGGRIETGWRFVATGLGWTPYGALEAIGYSAPRYAEAVLAGTGPLGLNYAARSTGTMRTELGLRLDGQARFDSGDLITYGRIAWAYQAATDRSIGAEFQTLANSAFTVFGARPSMHTALATLGAELRLHGGVRLSATLDGELGTRHQAIRANAGLRYAW